MGDASQESGKFWQRKMWGSRNDAFLSLLTRADVLWTTSCVVWGSSADLMQKAMLAGAKGKLWAGGSHSPVSTPLTFLCWVGMSPRPFTGNYISLSCLLTQEELITPIPLSCSHRRICVCLQCTCYKSLLHLAHIPGTASFTSSAPAVERETSFS